MPTLNAYSTLTLIEQAKRINPNGELAVIAEILSQDNEIMDNAIWLEANDIWSHKYTQRITLPKGAFRKLNGGVSPEASQTRQQQDGIAMLESYSEPDKALVDASPNQAQFRMQEAASFLEGMSQTWAGKLIYGNANTDPEEFTGLAPRLTSLGKNCISCGGSGNDLTSAYIMQWGETRVHMVFPRGSKTLGVEHVDLGEKTKTLADGSQYQIYRDHFKLYGGLVVRDMRCIARLANIETAGSSNTFATNAGDDKLLSLLNWMPMRGRGAVIYVNRTLLTQIEIMAKDKTNVFYTVDTPFGTPITTFRGIPIRRVDQILDTEAAVA